LQIRLSKVTKDPNYVIKVVNSIKKRYGEILSNIIEGMLNREPGRRFEISTVCDHLEKGFPDLLDAKKKDLRFFYFENQNLINSQAPQEQSMEFFPGNLNSRTFSEKVILIIILCNF